MSVNIEGYVSQTGAASGWYQNGRVVSAQEKEKDAPQPKADNAVKVSFSQEGIESYRKQTREKGISGRVVAKGNKESVIRQAKQAASAVTANAYGGELAGELKSWKGRGQEAHTALQTRWRIPSGRMATFMMKSCRATGTAQGSVMWRMKIQRRVSAK
jgi:hypothetical protein